MITKKWDTRSIKVNETVIHINFTEVESEYKPDMVGDYDSYLETTDPLIKKHTDTILNMTLMNTDFNEEDKLHIDNKTLKVTSLYSADEMILLLSILIEYEIKNITVNIEGIPDSMYWFCHDLIHVTQCSVELNPDIAELTVTNWEEEQANINGALIAHELKVPIDIIIKCLLGIKKGFTDRFNYDDNALDKFLKAIKIESKLVDELPSEFEV